MAIIIVVALMCELARVPRSEPLFGLQQLHWLLAEHYAGHRGDRVKNALFEVVLEIWTGG